MNLKLLEIIETKLGCLEVINRARNEWGYPVMRIYGKQERVHRVIWRECFGEIPPGLCVLHRCDNPACVNPYHLFLGTNYDNIMDRNSKGRQAKGEQQGNSKLVAEQVKEIRRSSASGVEIARQYKISQPHVSRIKTMKTWLALCVWGG